MHNWEKGNKGKNKIKLIPFHICCSFHLFTFFPVCFPGFEFDFTHILWISWASISFKTISGEFCWERFICFFVCFVVPFTRGNYKPLFISTGKYLGPCHDCPFLWIFKLHIFMHSSFSIFRILLQLWSSFVFSSQTYQHASTVIQSLVEEDINVRFLLQLDKLIRLLETPIFAYLRLQVH
jgi:hypothetical protein